MCIRAEAGAGAADAAGGTRRGGVRGRRGGKHGGGAAPSGSRPGFQEGGPPCHCVRVWYCCLRCASCADMNFVADSSKAVDGPCAGDCRGAESAALRAAGEGRGTPRQDEQGKVRVLSPTPCLETAVHLRALHTGLALADGGGMVQGGLPGVFRAAAGQVQARCLPGADHLPAGTGGACYVNAQDVQNGV